MWKDSTYVTFLTIKYRPQLKTLIPRGDIYRVFFGPVAVWSPFFDSCQIYSLFTANETGYFLLDDFTEIKDSTPEVSISGGTGYVDMNYMGPLYEHGNVNLKELCPDLDSLKRIPDKVYATRKWYKQWLKDHPGYKDQRTNDYRQQCE